MLEPIISYLPKIVENLIDTALGGVGDKVKNANAFALKKAEAELEKELSQLKHQQDLQVLRETQRHELQMELLSVIDKISQLDLSSREQLAACQQLMKIALALGSNDYAEKIEQITSTQRNVTSHGQTLTLPTSPHTHSFSPPPVSDSTSPTNNLSSAVGIDYTKLRNLLSAKKWKKADEETAKVMLKVARKEESGRLDIEDVNKFPYEDLQIIDQLWVKHSNGRFGFSVQKLIYQSLGGTREYKKEIWEAFGAHVGWHVNNSWLYYKDLTFSLDSCTPSGHLPAIGRVSLSWWKNGFDLWLNAPNMFVSDLMLNDFEWVYYLASSRSEPGGVCWRSVLFSRVDL